jgi:hypothetical protein
MFAIMSTRLDGTTGGAALLTRIAALTASAVCVGDVVPDEEPLPPLDPPEPERLAPPEADVEEFPPLEPPDAGRPRAVAMAVSVLEERTCEPLVLAAVNVFDPVIVTGVNVTKKPWVDVPAVEVTVPGVKVAATARVGGVDRSDPARTTGISMT